MCVYAQRMRRKPNTSHALKHDAKRRKQHSAIRHVLTVEGERLTVVLLTFDCVCV